MTKKGNAVLGSLLLAMLLSGCQKDIPHLFDGYYTAEADDFDENGWKEFVTIYTNNNQIVTVEYNAINASGFIKSWDMEYMRLMNRISGSYPNQYTRYYAVSLLNRQDPSKIDAISGATHSYYYFQSLAWAAIAKARAGDKHVALVALPPPDGR
ncbi:major membrane immunogen [Leadbettera azotonutricia]|uniref:Major membrane immunogen n=1 Tax=Leadbettera azotonutricia (strain ATCC BAA-888 / DSM 13862 / ZAS-9) TaxID=545695 RepID=F5YEW9_LEAAZ|nr:major membrane immunogen [Leadbettera azotonutricia]AEF81792.1 major membrane immunogen [Leadbettera azotonutricia ZAS-9]